MGTATVELRSCFLIIGTYLNRCQRSGCEVKGPIEKRVGRKVIGREGQ